MGSKLLLTYNIRTQSQEDYMRFMINDFIPTMQSIGLLNVGVWHTAYGDYPDRLLIFSADTAAKMERALSGKTFGEMEEKLKGFVSDYSRRVVPADTRFQF